MLEPVFSYSHGKARRCVIQIHCSDPLLNQVKWDGELFNKVVQYMIEHMASSLWCFMSWFIQVEVKVLQHYFLSYSGFTFKSGF